MVQGVADIQHNLSLYCSAGAGTDLCNLIKVFYDSKFPCFPSAQRNTPRIKMWSAVILFSLYQDAVLFSPWRLTPVS